MKDSKEFNNVLEAIDKWVKKHEGKAHFVGSFMAFKGKECKVIDDRMFAFGIKSMLREELKTLDEGIEKEKEDFVNW